MKPVVIYIDDEPRNHVAFESILPESWSILCFDEPLEAIDAITKSDPWIVVSDQRMPKKSGNEVLEVVKSLKPNAVRIITTGYSDEQLVIDSIRTAQVHDYIVKPWEPNDFARRLERWVEYYQTNCEKIRLEGELSQREFELREQNSKLIETTSLLERTLSEQEELVKELRSWVHPFVLKAKDERIKFPIKRDLALLVIDIIESGKIHGVMVGGQNLREKILQSLWEIVLKHGGEIESQEGDKAYAHFGLLDEESSRYKAAYAAAKEFRSSLQAINDHYETNVECGIALHTARECLISVRQTVLNMPNGIEVRKKFDTCSSDVDLVHRLESISHSLPGTNILITRAFAEELSSHRESFISVGNHFFKGQSKECEVLLLKSNTVTDVHLKQFIEKLNRQTENLKELMKRAA